MLLGQIPQLFQWSGLSLQPILLPGSGEWRLEGEVDITTEYSYNLFPHRGHTFPIFSLNWACDFSALSILTLTSF